MEGYMNVKSFLFKNLASFVAIIIVLTACATSGAMQNETTPSADQTAQYEQEVRYYQEQNLDILRGLLKMNGAFRGTTENAGLTLRFDFGDENFSINDIGGKNETDG